MYFVLFVYSTSVSFRLSQHTGSISGQTQSLMLHNIWRYNSNLPSALLAFFCLDSPPPSPDGPLTEACKPQVFPRPAQVSSSATVLFWPCLSENSYFYSLYRLPSFALLPCPPSHTNTAPCLSLSPLYTSDYTVLSYGFIPQVMNPVMLNIDCTNITQKTL
jgi:hypothetical protein